MDVDVQMVGCMHTYNCNTACSTDPNGSCCGGTLVPPPQLAHWTALAPRKGPPDSKPQLEQWPSEARTMARAAHACHHSGISQSLPAAAAAARAASHALQCTRARVSGALRRNTAVSTSPGQFIRFQFCLITIKYTVISR